VKLAQKNNLTEEQFGELVSLCIEMLDDPDYNSDDASSSSSEEGEDDLVIESITISRTADGFYKIN
tara:strand:- start:570 stop:767 length:198 start_codon:yes stop_codon:yes gene_type:complete